MEWNGPQGSKFGPLIFNIFMNDLFYFEKSGNLFNYAGDNSVSVNNKEMDIVCRLLQSKARLQCTGFVVMLMEENPSKF